MLAELERVAGNLILLSRGRVQLAGEVGALLASHRLLTGPAAEGAGDRHLPVRLDPGLRPIADRGACGKTRVVLQNRRSDQTRTEVSR